MKKLESGISFRAIAEYYHINVSTVSDINCGDIWYDQFRQYPIVETKYRKMNFSKSDIKNIYQMLEKGISLSEISRLYNTSITTISKINNGIIYHDSSVMYPIWDSGMKRMSSNIVLAIANVLLTTNMSYISISRQFSVGRKTVSGIDHGSCYKNILEEHGYTQFPLRHCQA